MLSNCQENCNANYQEKKIVYFNKMGKANTEDTLRLAKERFDELGLKKVIIATSFGDTAVKALEYFKGEELVVINSMYGFREPGKQSMKPEYEEQLKAAGATIIRTTHLFAALDRSINRKYGGITLTQFMGQIFKMLGEGFKVCAEMAAMAADCGGVPVDEEVMAIAGTGRGCDTAVVLVPAHSNDYFKLQFKEIVCMPRVRSLKGQPL
jgi:hypothetical protein